MPNYIMGNLLLPRKDPTKPVNLEESSMMIRGVDTTNNRFSTDG
jgi:hypothetical protein